MVAGMFKAFRSVYNIKNFKSLFKETKPMTAAERLIKLVNRLDFTDRNGRNIKDYITWDGFVTKGIYSEDHFNGSTPAPPGATPLDIAVDTRFKKSWEESKTQHDVDKDNSEPMTRAEHEEHRKQGRMTGKLYADGQEYKIHTGVLGDDVPGTEDTLYAGGYPYLKQIEVNDPATFELTYDRLLDEVLSNPSATGLKVEVTKEKLVATLEYRQ